MNHLFHLHCPTYINIMNSFNNEPHYIVLCPSVINPLYRSDILLTMFFLKVTQNTLFFQCKKSHFIPVKIKGISDLLVDHTFHCKWYFTRNESQNRFTDGSKANSGTGSGIFGLGPNKSFCIHWVNLPQSFKLKSMPFYNVHKKT